MAKRSVMLVLPLLAAGTGLLAGSSMWMKAQEDTGDNSVIRKVVEMVQLNVAVTDKKGNYVTGLSPADFVIVEDRIPQKIATFEEGTGAPQNLEGPGQGNAAAPQLIPRGAAGLKSGSPEIVDQSNALANQSHEHLYFIRHQQLHVQGAGLCVRPGRHR